MGNLNFEVNVEEFKEQRNCYHRYASFDFCYSYFYQNKGKLKDLLQESCSQLWSYLSSWGMLRGSSELLQKSYKCLEPLIKHFDSQKTLWDIDVDKYNNDNINKIINEYNAIKDILTEQLAPTSPTKTLVTKIMLGVYGIVPAYDTYFTETFREYFTPKCSFRSFNKVSLQCIAEFYKEHKSEIDNIKINVINFNGNDTKMLYSKAKIIDMFGFEYGINK